MTAPGCREDAVRGRFTPAGTKKRSPEGAGSKQTAPALMAPSCSFAQLGVCAIIHLM